MLIVGWLTIVFLSLRTIEFLSTVNIFDEYFDEIVRLRRGSSCRYCALCRIQIIGKFPLASSPFKRKQSASETRTPTATKLQCLMTMAPHKKTTGLQGGTTQENRNSLGGTNRKNRNCLGGTNRKNGILWEAPTEKIGILWEAPTKKMEFFGRRQPRK